MPTSEDLYQRALQFLRTGDNQGARELLKRVIRDDVHNVNAWMRYAGTLSSSEERIKVLRWCLKYNSDNEMVQSALSRLQREHGDGWAAGTPARTDGGDVRGWARRGVGERRGRGGTCDGWARRGRRLVRGWAGAAGTPARTCGDAGPNVRGGGRGRWRRRGRRLERAGMGGHGGDAGSNVRGGARAGTAGTPARTCGDGWARRGRRLERAGRGGRGEDAGSNVRGWAGTAGTSARTCGDGWARRGRSARTCGDGRARRGRRPERAGVGGHGGDAGNGVGSNVRGWAGAARTPARAFMHSWGRSWGLVMLLAVPVSDLGARPRSLRRRQWQLPISRREARRSASLYA